MADVDTDEIEISLRFRRETTWSWRGIPCWLVRVVKRLGEPGWLFPVISELEGAAEWLFEVTEPP